MVTKSNLNQINVDRNQQTNIDIDIDIAVSHFLNHFQNCNKRIIIKIERITKESPPTASNKQ